MIAGAVYFAIVFTVGFALGAIRTIWVVPRLGVRKAELIEAPFMLAVTIFAAHWTVRHFAVPSYASIRLGMGLAALVLLLMAEFGLVLWVRGVSLGEYFRTRDRVAGAVYYFLLAIFALMPLAQR